MEISESKFLTPNEFTVIVDRDGDVVDMSIIHDDSIQAAIRLANKESPEYAPYIALYWNGKKWNQWA